MRGAGLDGVCCSLFGMSLSQDGNVSSQAVTAELVGEIGWYEGELQRRNAGATLLGEAFAQSRSMFFTTLRALRSYLADLEALANAVAPGHLQVQSSVRAFSSCTDGRPCRPRGVWG